MGRESWSSFSESNQEWRSGMLDLHFMQRGIFSGPGPRSRRVDARLASDQIMELHGDTHAVVGIRIVGFSGARGRYGKKEHDAENDCFYEFAHLQIHPSLSSSLRGYSWLHTNPTSKY